MQMTAEKSFCLICKKVRKDDSGEEGSPLNIASVIYKYSRVKRLRLKIIINFFFLAHFKSILVVKCFVLCLHFMENISFELL